MGTHEEPQTKPLWVPSPKIRRWLYALSIPLAALLVAYGLMEPDKVPLWVSFLGVLFGVTNGVAVGNVSDK